MNKFKTFLKDNAGAIAVETAIAMPIMIFAFLRAMDIGLQVYQMQSMTKATKSGTEYVVNGGRDAETIETIMSDSYGERLNSRHVKIKAYCACIVENEPDENEIDETGTEFGGTYTKMETTLSEDMCPANCDSGSEMSALVSISFTKKQTGILTDKTLNSTLQTRVQ